MWLSTAGLTVRVIFAPCLNVCTAKKIAAVSWMYLTGKTKCDKSALVYGWASVADGGPTVYRRWF